MLAPVNTHHRRAAIASGRGSSFHLKCPYYGFLKMTFHVVNENILQSVKGAVCKKFI